MDLGYRLEYAEQLIKGEAPFQCPKCSQPLPINAVIYQASSGGTSLYCLRCNESFKIDFKEVKGALAKLLKGERREFKDYNFDLDESYDGDEARIHIKWFGCPNCGICNDEVEYHRLFEAEGWLDDNGEFRRGEPIIFNVMPNKAACRNCGGEFKIEEDIKLHVYGNVYNQSEIRMSCPKCGYAWVDVEGYPMTYRIMLKFRAVGLLGFKCLACGGEIYYRILKVEGPSLEPITRVPKQLKYRRLFKSLENYRGRLMQSVSGTEFQRLMRGERLSLTRSHVERAALDFENRIQPVIKLIVEKMFWGQQREIILEEALRCSRYIWVKCNKAGRTPSYIILGIIHYAHALQVLLARQKAAENPKMDTTLVGRAFPLQKCWGIIDPNRKFKLKTYERNLDWLLEQLEVRRWKHPKAFKSYMLLLAE